MSNISGKIWGQTKLIHANGVLEFHRIEYKKDISCSKHRHKYKWNGFYVESGKMKVKVWKNDYDFLFSAKKWGGVRGTPTHTNF